MTALAKLFRATAFRLSLAIFGISVIGAGLLLGVVYWQVIKLFEDETMQRIDAESNRLEAIYGQGGVRQLGDAIEVRSRSPGSSLYLLTNSAGVPLAGNISQLPPGFLDRDGFVHTRYAATDGSIRNRPALAKISTFGGFHVLIGHDLSDIARVGAVMLRALATSLIFFAGLAGLGALFVARRVLRRIDAMNSSAHAIMAGDLTQRLPVSGSDDELDRLALGLNQMLARIADLMVGLREVSDNIAHDLRTPLNRLRNHAEEALRLDREEPEYRAALERTIEESDSLIRIFDALLLIARAEAGSDRAAMSVFDVSAVVTGIAELYEPVAEEKGFRLSVAAPPGLTMLGNRELVGQATANLIDNALKYGASNLGSAGSNQITVASRREGGNILIEIADHGPGVMEADRQRVFDRFVRLEGARSRPGSGLGLSLAAAAARMHGGFVRLEDNMPGLKVVVTLPAAEAALPPQRAAA